MKYDVIFDALIVICDKNLKRQREFGDICSIGIAMILAKNREIA